MHRIAYIVKVPENVTLKQVFCRNSFKLCYVYLHLHLHWKWKDKKKYEQNVLIYWFKLHCSNTFIIYIFNVCIVSCDEHIYLYFRNIGKLFSCLPMLIFSLCVCCFSFSFSICVLLLLVSLCNKTLDDTVVHTMNHCVTLYSHTHKQNWRCIRGNVEMCGTIEIC